MTRRSHLGATALIAAIASCGPLTPSIEPSASATPGPTPSPNLTPTAVTGAVIPCRTTDLSIGVTNTGGGGGNAGGYLVFLNTGGAACSLQGAPRVLATSAEGLATEARTSATVGTPFPSLSGAPTVILLPGERAFAAYGGSDTSGSAATCPPPYRTFRVSPPGDTAGVDIPALNVWLGADQPSCSGIEVTMIAPSEALADILDVNHLHP